MRAVGSVRAATSCTLLLGYNAVAQFVNLGPTNAPPPRNMPAPLAVPSLQPPPVCPASFGASASVKISLDASFERDIVGTGGVNSKQICQQSGAKLFIRYHDKDPNLRNIELEGTFDKIKEASAMVKDLIARCGSMSAPATNDDCHAFGAIPGRMVRRMEPQLPPPFPLAIFGASATAIISVDASLAGVVIGRGGVNSKQICRYSGARFLTIRDHETDPNLRNVVLIGMFDQVEQASAIIRHLIAGRGSVNAPAKPVCVEAGGLAHGERNFKKFRY